MGLYQVQVILPADGYPQAPMANDQKVAALRHGMTCFKLLEQHKH